MSGVEEFHVVIGCPPWWSQRTADILAARLQSTELPAECGVYLWRLVDGKLTEQTVLQETADDPE